MNKIYKFDHESHKNAIAFLKGIIIAYAKECGMKHSSTKPETEFFEKGRTLVEKKSYLDSYWITIVHIIYNRLRHRRPHKSSFEADQEYLNQNSYLAHSVIESLSEILGEDASKLMEGF